jgi:hypothetical protein
MAARPCPKCGVPIKVGTYVTVEDREIVVVKLNGTVGRRQITIWMCPKCWREHDAE